MHLCTHITSFEVSHAEREIRFPCTSANLLFLFISWYEYVNVRDDQNRRRQRFDLLKNYFDPGSRGFFSSKKIPRLSSWKEKFTANFTLFQLAVYRHFRWSWTSLVVHRTLRFLCPCFLSLFLSFFINKLDSFPLEKKVEKNRDWTWDFFIVLFKLRCCHVNINISTVIHKNIPTANDENGRV